MTMAKRKEFYTLADHAARYKNVKRGSVTNAICNFYVSSPVEMFYTDVQLDCEGKPVTILQTDIAMLFNQQRLDKMTSQALVDYLSQSTNMMKQGNLGKYTPEQLSQFVKSRYCQSPSELAAWIDYLDQNYNELSQELQAQVDAAKAQKGDSQPQSQTPVQPDAGASAE